MKVDFSKEFQEVRIDLDIDLADRGGLQRFRTFGELEQWLAEELGFWDWFKSGQGSHYANQALGRAFNEFFAYNSQAREYIGQIRTHFDSTKAALDQTIEISENSDRREALRQDFVSQLENFKSRIDAVIVSSFVTHKHHFYRGLPESVFVKEVALTDHVTATFVLVQFIQDQLGGDSSAHETKGRVLALLYARGWLPRKESQKLAYGESIKSWKQDLAHYKSDYEKLIEEYHGLCKQVEDDRSIWLETTKKLEEEFNSQQKSNDEDLKHLKDTYESHMQLHGPMSYWKSKRVEHDRAIQSWRVWCCVAAALGVAGLVCSGILLLPETTSVQEIPWKRLGAFLVIGTVVIWLMRFPFKMLLSHIHLRGDAKEREVMISTYMALLRGVDGKQGISKEDLVLVLTPIFRPATSGLIKDDGGPASILELLSRLK